MSVEVDGDRLVVYPSRTRLTFLLLVSIAFVAIGLLLASPGMTGRVAASLRILAIAGVLLFTMSGVYAAYRLYRHHPLLVADSSGIVDSGSAIWWKRRLMRVGMALGATPTNIPEATLPVAATGKGAG